MTGEMAGRIYSDLKTHVKQNIDFNPEFAGSGKTNKLYENKNAIIGWMSYFDIIATMPYNCYVPQKAFKKMFKAVLDDLGIFYYEKIYRSAGLSWNMFSVMYFPGLRYRPHYLPINIVDRTPVELLNQGLIPCLRCKQPNMWYAMDARDLEYPDYSLKERIIFADLQKQWIPQRKKEFMARFAELHSRSNVKQEIDIPDGLIDEMLGSGGFAGLI